MPTPTPNPSSVIALFCFYARNAPEPRDTDSACWMINTAPHAETACGSNATDYHPADQQRRWLGRSNTRTKAHSIAGGADGFNSGSNDTASNTSYNIVTLITVLQPQAFTAQSVGAVQSTADRMHSRTAALLSLMWCFECKHVLAQHIAQHTTAHLHPPAFCVT